MLNLVTVFSSHFSPWPSAMGKKIYWLIKKYVMYIYRHMDMICRVLKYLPLEYHIICVMAMYV